MTIATSRAVLPMLRAAGIAWRRSGAFLEVGIELANESPAPTEESTLVIEAAPFGAFVPFEPVARLTVAGFAPFERRRVSVRVPAVRLAFASFPPTLAPEADPGPKRADVDAFARVRQVLDTTWAGNLNVYFDRAPADGVELHRALGLKVRAGKDASFFFGLGDEGYVIETWTSDSEWSVKAMAWPFSGVLVVTPPSQPGRAANVEVRVTRTTDGKTVPVVFGMETVAGAGDTLGCLEI